MSRHGFHSFTSTAPVFAFDDVDPFFEPADREATRLTPERESPAVPLVGRAPATINQETRK